MVRKVEYVKQGELFGERTVFMRELPKSRPDSSQSVHSSEESG